MMKHPALTRVFAVVLCIFAVLLLFAAAAGVRSAVKDRAEAVHSYELLSSRADEYEALLDRLDEEGSADKAQQELDKLKAQYEKDKSAHQLALATYTATKGGLKQGKELMSAADEMMSATNIVSSIESAVSGIANQLFDLEDVALNAYANYDAAAQEALPLELAYYEALAASTLFPDDPALAAAVEEAYLAMLPYEMQKDLAQQQIEALVEDVSSSASDVSSGDMLSSVGTLAAAYDAMNAGKAELEKMELQVIRDSIDLSLRKAELEKEEAEISAAQDLLGDIRSDERRLISLRVSMTANDDVKEIYDRSGNVLTAARNVANSEEKAARNSFLLEIGKALLMLAAAAMAFAGMPAAYEKVKKRSALIAPVVLYTLFCTAVELLSVLLQGEQHYLALFAAIFGVIQLIITLPKTAT